MARAGGALLLASATLASIAGCGDPIEAGSLTFDFDGTLIPIDGPGPAVAITNTSSWLGNDVRSRLVLRSTASALPVERRTGVARAVVTAVVTDALVTLCRDGAVTGASDAILAFQSLCAARSGRSTPRRFCVGIDRLSLADHPGGDEIVDPPPAPDICSATDPTTTTTGPIPAAGFSLTSVAPAFGYPLGPPGRPGTLVQFALTVPPTTPPTSFAIVASVPLIQPALDRTLPLELTPSPLAADCPVGGRPGTTGNCSLSFSFAPTQPTTAARDLTLTLAMVAPDSTGLPRNFTLSSYVPLPVFAGTWSVVEARCGTSTVGATRVHTMTFPLSGASTFLYGGAIYETGAFDPIATASFTVAGAAVSGGTRVDLPGPVDITVAEPTDGPSLFDDAHEIRVQALVGVATRIMTIPLRGGC